MRRSRWAVHVDDYGPADVQVRVGDADGSGEAPSVQLEFEHPFSRGRQAVAMSAREAELLSRALAQAATQIRPSDRLRARRRKWERSFEGAR